MAEKDTKNNTEPMKRLNKSVTRFLLGTKTFLMQEMAIGRAQKFLIKLGDSFESVKEHIGKDITQIDFRDLMTAGGDVLFEKLTELFNFLMEYKNDGYESVDIEWVKDNLTISDLQMIGKELADQNRMGWLVPFFKEKMQEAIAS